MDHLDLPEKMELMEIQERMVPPDHKDQWDLKDQKEKLA